MPDARNVLGSRLQVCCANGGYTREGFCYVPSDDIGNHSVCAIMTEAFLSYSTAVGNDLSTPRPEYLFEGLKPGDKWCLCAVRWEQARREGVAPEVILEATNEACLSVTSLENLKAHEYHQSTSGKGA